MHLDKNKPKYLGEAFLLQAIASAIWTYLLSSLIVVGDISASMTNIADRPLQMRASILFALITAIGVAMLGALLYTVLQKQNKTIALIALALYVLEAGILAVSRMDAFSLLRISQESVLAGHPDNLLILGNLLYDSANFGDFLHMLPFAFGAILFYSLFFKSGYIPQALSLFGLAAASLAFFGTLFSLLGLNVPLVVFLPNLPFELTTGVWLIVKGIKDA